MKKTIIAVILFVLSICMVACGSGEDSTDNSKSKESSSQESGSMDETVSDEETVFEQFEKVLDNKGVEYTTVIMAASLIGAKEGFKYKIGDGSVELYLFDRESEAYKTAEEKQKLMLENFGEFDAVVENGMALLVSGLDEDEYLEIYRNLNND